MTTSLYEKGIVLAIIGLFIGVGFTPTLVSGDQPPDEEWNRTFGGSNDDMGEWVEVTSDGGYIIAGRTSSYGSGQLDAWLIKTDSNGNELWSKTFGGPAKDWIECVRQTTDGGYILGGTTQSYGAGNSDWWLIKTDSAGNMLWDKTYGGPSLEVMQRVVQTTDGGYILVGNTESFDVGGGDVWLIKTDSSGNVIWSKTFGGSSLEHGFSVRQTTDGGYIITGLTKSYGAGVEDVWLIKTDSNGNMIWSKTFGGPAWDHGYSVRQTTDGGYIMGGATASSGAGNWDMLLIKTDSSGTEVWNKTHGGSNRDSCNTVQQTSDGGYIISGYRDYPSEDWWLIKTDEYGDEKWNKTFGGTSPDIGRAVQQTSDSGYIVVGETISYGAGGSKDVWLIKVAPESGGSPPDGLVAYWSFDDGPGSTTATDESDYHNDGTLINMDTSTCWVDGVSGYALDLDGIDDYVNAGNDASLTDITPSASTISAWIYNEKTITPGTNDLRTIVGQRAYHQHNGYGMQYGYCVDMGVHDYIISDVFFGGYCGCYFEEIPTGQWIHVVGVFGNDVSTIYINGEAKPTTQIDYFSGYTSSNEDVMIGREGNWGYRYDYHNGLIDEVRIYNRALSETEIQDLYNQGGGNQPPNPPTDLAQFKTDGTLIDVGEIIYETTVVFKGKISDPDGDSVKLQAELRRLDEYGGLFNEASGEFKESEFVESGNVATAYAYGLIAGSYHWRVRAVDKYGEVSEWLDFGNNDILEADFIVPYTIEVSPAYLRVDVNDVVTFNGRVIDQYGNGVANVQVCIDDPIKESCTTTTTDTNGYFYYLTSANKVGSFLFGFYIGSITRTSIISVDLDVKISAFPELKIQNTGDQPIQAVLYIDGMELGTSIVNAGSTEPIMMSTIFDPICGVDVGVPVGIGGVYVDSTGTWKVTGGEVIVGSIYFKGPGTVGICGGLGGGIYGVIEGSGSLCIGTDGIYAVGSGGTGVSHVFCKIEIISFESPSSSIYVKSPVTLMVKDPTGNKVGYESEIGFINQIEGATYTGPHTKPQEINIPRLLEGSYEIDVIGTESGNYTLLYMATLGEETLAIFNSVKIPTSLNGIHQYFIDWVALSQGEEGVTIQIDSDGDGTFERTITSDSELTHDEFMLQTATTIDIDPDTLNLNSNGMWITCYIELPEGYDVAGIDVNTILLNDIVPTESHPTNISDYDDDGIPDLMVKFDRQDVIDILEPGENVAITVAGELIDGTRFEGTDYIKVI